MNLPRVVFLSLGILIAIVPAGTAQAALSLNNFVGFETNGSEEAIQKARNLTEGLPPIVFHVVSIFDGGSYADSFDFHLS